MEFPNRIASLTKLKTIVLSNCANWDCLPPLGKLLTLEELSIEGMNNVKVVGVEFLGVHGDGRMLRNRVGDEISETNRFQGLGMPVIQKAGVFDNEPVGLGLGLWDTK
ncbi:hypothetical protein COLO4_26695 [Corchorus olitorius]|uniref:R13L1/DRL21-like LRR repeat region domain-containing protein n=1 Tax=Corchorus olitorius TaxID=93759 RepID=A0A1R3HUX4_9ROSI|nr:hypothetical protein COLO4_26695 [Corchorus olitorius]